MTAGRTALEKIINGEDYAQAIADMEAGFFGFVGVGVIGASQQVINGTVQVVSYRSYSLKSGGIF